MVNNTISTSVSFITLAYPLSFFKKKGGRSKFKSDNIHFQKQMGQINPQAKIGYCNFKHGDTYVYINLKPEILDLRSEFVTKLWLDVAAGRDRVRT